MRARWVAIFVIGLSGTALAAVVLVAIGGNNSSSESCALSLEAPSEVRAGETVPLRMKCTNTSYLPIKLTLGGRPPYEFVVTTPAGVEVWRSTYGGFVLLVLDHEFMKPKGKLEFATEWKQVDKGGTHVATASYLVRGILHLEPPRKIETEAKWLTISP